MEKREGINKAVNSDVQEVFKEKTVEQLVLLQVKRRRKDLYFLLLFLFFTMNHQAQIAGKLSQKLEARTGYFKLGVAAVSIEGSHG